MKKSVISVAFLAMLSGVSVSCQKETITEEVSQNTVSETVTLCTVSYTVDGVVQTILIKSLAEWNDFMLCIRALAEEGHYVRVFNEKTELMPLAAKEKIVYTTSDKKAFDAWVLQKVLEGYDVTITYNQQAGEYTGIAVR